MITKYLFEGFIFFVILVFITPTLISWGNKLKTYFKNIGKDEDN